jgi:hypothetical protein
MRRFRQFSKPVTPAVDKPYILAHSGNQRTRCETVQEAYELAWKAQKANPQFSWRIIDTTKMQIKTVDSYVGKSTGKVIPVTWNQMTGT